MKTKNVAVISLAVVLIGTLVGMFVMSQTADAEHRNFKKLVIGFIPTEKAEELTPKAKDLEEYLEEKFRYRLDVEVLVPTSYEALIEGLRFGHVHAAFMDAGPGWITHKKTGAEIVLAEVVDGKIYYQATVFARAGDDSIKTLDDVIGKRVAFTSMTGSSGFVRPIGTLIEKGLIKVDGNDLVALESALVKEFRSYTFAGGYKSALKLLVNGNVDVAFGAEDAPQRFLTPEDQGKIRIVEKIGPVPSHVFVVDKNMPRIIKNLLVRAMTELNYDEHNQILREIYGAEALLPTTTTMHVGDFGDKINALVGLEEKILDKIK
jgi:phosphonate transport system substrate-binding protein